MRPHLADSDDRVPVSKGTDSELTVVEKKGGKGKKEWKDTGLESRPTKDRA